MVIRVAVVAMFALVLAACTPTNPNNGGHMDITPTEAREELYSLLDMVKQFHESEWETAPSGALPCTTGDGKDGVRFLQLMSGDGLEGEAQVALLDAMATAWTDAGFEPVRSVRPEVNGIVVTDQNYPAGGPGVDGLVLQLAVGPNSVTLSGQSRCVPGDPAEVNESD